MGNRTAGCVAVLVGVVAIGLLLALSGHRSGREEAKRLR